MSRSDVSRFPTSLTSGHAGKRLTNITLLDGDSCAVGLVDDAVNFLDVVRVGEDLVAGDDVLSGHSVLACLFSVDIQLLLRAAAEANAVLGPAQVKANS